MSASIAYSSLCAISYNVAGMSSSREFLGAEMRRPRSREGADGEAAAEGSPGACPADVVRTGSVTGEAMLAASSSGVIGGKYEWIGVAVGLREHASDSRSLDRL
jgi:hypothetical protein